VLFGACRRQDARQQKHQQQQQFTAMQ
jgi:hypothetical protein